MEDFQAWTRVRERDTPTLGAVSRRTCRKSLEKFRPNKHWAGDPNASPGYGLQGWRVG